MKTAVLWASSNSFLPNLLAKPVLLIPSFLGIGVNEYSGNKVTILLALLLILLISLFKTFSKF